MEKEFRVYPESYKYFMQKLFKEPGENHTGSSVFQNVEWTPSKPTLFLKENNFDGALFPTREVLITLEDRTKLTSLALIVNVKAIVDAFDDVHHSLRVISVELIVK